MGSIVFEGALIKGVKWQCQIVILQAPGALIRRNTVYVYTAAYLSQDYSSCRLQSMSDKAPVRPIVLKIIIFIKLYISIQKMSTAI